MKARPQTRAAARIMVGCIALVGAAAPMAADKAGDKRSEWRPTSCPVVPETGGGPGSLKVTGPCPFEHKGLAECEIHTDDYDADVHRKGRDGGPVLLHISVEHNIVPGSYKDNEITFSIQDKSKIYRWASKTVELTVGAGLETIDIHDARLEPEPVLVNCTGPLNNYQCDGRGDEEEVLKTFPVVSGTLHCKRKK
jgi:hypothetical protein